MMLPYRSDHEPRSKPILTQLLLMANVISLAYTSSFSHEQLDAFLYRYAFIPFDWTWPNLVTHMFLHGGFLHLFGNMLFLWIFAPAIEDRLGKLAFLPAYLFFGIAAALAHAATVSSGLQDLPVVGASGAISGIMGAYMVFYPRVSIRHVFIALLRPIFFSLPAWMVLGMWLGEQFLFSFYADYLNVAIWAHIGGFTAGALTAWVLQQSGFRTQQTEMKIEASPRHDFEYQFAAGADPERRWNTVREELKKNSHDPVLRHAAAAAALRMEDYGTARTIIAELLHDPAGITPEHRFDALLLAENAGERVATADGLLEIADFLSSAGHWQEAWPRYLEFLEKFSNHPRQKSVQLWAGEMFYQKMNQPEEATVYLEAAAIGDHRSPLAQEARFLLDKITAHQGGTGR